MTVCGSDLVRSTRSERFSKRSPGRREPSRIGGDARQLPEASDHGKWRAAGFEPQRCCHVPQIRLQLRDVTAVLGGWPAACDARDPPCRFCAIGFTAIMRNGGAQIVQFRPRYWICHAGIHERKPGAIISVAVPGCVAL